MDELDLLKKDWNKEGASFKNYQVSDIYQMLHKKSSSIVKTLFYISVAELIFWILISYVPYTFSDNLKERLDASYEDPIFVALTVFSFLVVFLFVCLLYISHKSISSTDNAKKLMESILKTRKVIKYYVLYNLVMIFISVPLSLYFEFNENSEFHSQVAGMNSTQMLVLFIITVVVMGIFVVVIWLFYRLLYGILLKRLNRNYEELKKLEI
ncbi:hypothetical protein [Winogradskyella aurantia]|uniref:Beta-carotene 15,15'-monooxygenase n=1 Tax=Winogradskyella aurantia TaxID=1915063 RepID=A0A265UQR2_9FLAO|nr:hypothetical protein [Winogradskyella aurantia]OZV67661.1 hypothetical protein CA834_11995 [Winogradskyella aurantia]